MLNSIWLIDLQSHLPSSALLDGFDVSSLQFPPKEWLPPNVSLKLLNILEEVPEHLHGKYDVVNIRYFCCVVKDNDPGLVIKNVLKMLSISRSSLYYPQVSEICISFVEN